MSITRYIAILIICLTLFIANIAFPLRSIYAATPQYPDLKTVPPTDLQFDEEEIDGSQHTVLRFTNTVWNAGEGLLELHGINESSDRTRVFQRVFNDDGSSSDQDVGFFVFHQAHNHWHFEDFAEYQLWTRADYEAWIQNGRNAEEARNTNYKTTFCIRETSLFQHLPGTPTTPVHTQCGQEIQGLAVGWGDSYRYDLPEQWIDVGTTVLPDGEYVIRSVADPNNILKESANSDPARENDVANEGVTYFTVLEGHITPAVSVTPEPSVTVAPTPSIATPTPAPTNGDPDTYRWNHYDWRQLLTDLLRRLNDELPMW